MLRNRGIMFMIVIALALVISGCGSNNNEKQMEPDAVVAVYDGGEVTREQLDKYLSAMIFIDPKYEQFIGISNFEEILLKQQIAFQLMYNDAEESQRTEANASAKEQMKTYLDSLKAQYGEETVDESLKELNITAEDIENVVAQNILVMNVMEGKLSKEEILDEYENMKADFTVVTVRHILISTINAQTQETIREDEAALARANEVRDKLLAGGDFDALAKQYSDDEGSKDKGGKYEDWEAGNFVEEFKIAANELELNSISEPVKTTYGYHVIKVEKRAEKSFEQLDEASQTVVKSAAAQDLMTDYIDNELPKHIEEINLPKAE